MRVKREILITMEMKSPHQKRFDQKKKKRKLGSRSLANNYPIGYIMFITTEDDLDRLRKV